MDPQRMAYMRAMTEGESAGADPTRQWNPASRSLVDFYRQKEFPMNLPGMNEARVLAMTGAAAGEGALQTARGIKGGIENFMDAGQEASHYGETNPDRSAYINAILGILNKNTMGEKADELNAPRKPRPEVQGPVNRYL